MDRLGVVKLGAMLVALLWVPLPAMAGAWTLPKGDIQIISGTTFATADHAFDNNSKPTVRIGYQKELLQLYGQYGLTDKITLFVSPEYAIATSAPLIGVAAAAKDAAVGGGVRFRLTDAIGVVSLEASLKTAGAFNLSVSANGVSGRQAELRLLYGKGFKIAERDAFVDVEAAARWVSGDRPNEVPVDLTVGWHATPKLMLMAQNFNIVSGSARAPFGYYRSHKVELSAVYKFDDRSSIQLGGFVSPAGQNALQERGATLSVWTSL